MLNQHTRTLKLTRHEVCDLLIAIHSCEESGTKWQPLADKIKAQLDKQDEKDDLRADIDIYL